MVLMSLGLLLQEWPGVLWELRGQLALGVDCRVLVASHVRVPGFGASATCMRQTRVILL